MQRITLLPFPVRQCSGTRLQCFLCACPRTQKSAARACMHKAHDAEWPRVGACAQVVEAKGLDMVRRDWCGLAKDCGNYCLGRILSGAPAEEVVDAIHAKLHEARAHRCRCSACPSQHRAHSHWQLPASLPDA